MPSSKPNPLPKPAPVGLAKNSDKDYSKWSTASPEEVNKFHARDDADTSAFAHHHTLGPRRDQASPGNHTHDGKTSIKLGSGLGLTLTGSKGSNAALTSLISLLANFIDFEDTTT